MPEDPRPSGWFCWLCLREVATLIWVTLGNTKAAPICAGCASRLPSCQVYTPEELELARGLKKGTPARVPAPLAKKLVEAGWAEVLAPGQDGEKADSPAPGQAAQERGGREGASEQGEEGRGVRVWNPFQCPACGKYLHWRSVPTASSARTRSARTTGSAGLGPVFRPKPLDRR
jgi:hypothetical protein